MRILTLIWLALMALAVVGTGGCFVSTAPVISTGAGMDLGAELTFLTYEPEGSDIRPSGFRLTRQDDGRYQLRLFDPDKSQAQVGPPEPPMMLLDLQRIGSRDGAPVVLMQAQLPDSLAVSLEQNFGIGFITLRPDGVGVMAAPDCQSPDLLTLAEKHQLRLSCALSADAPYFLSLDSATSADRLWAFLSDGLEAGIIQWEDGLGVSLLDSSGL